MVEKRTIAFVMLATLVWTSIATGSVAYYYLEYIKCKEQFEERQLLLNELSKNYGVSASKRNSLSADYAALFGEYQWFSAENYSSLMNRYEILLSDLRGNYTPTFSEFSEFNETYNNLLNNFRTFTNKSAVTREEFGLLLDEFYKLLTALAMKELDDHLGQVTTIKVSFCINYGNSTIQWYNTSTSIGTTLFDLTLKTAKVQYSYWPTMEPGHILVDSINDYSDGYWVWYYWDEMKNEWIFGPVGCDAWVLEDSGIYNWTCVK